MTVQEPRVKEDGVSPQTRCLEQQRAKRGAVSRHPGPGRLSQGSSSTDQPGENALVGGAFKDAKGLGRPPGQTGQGDTPPGLVPGRAASRHLQGHLLQGQPHLHTFSEVAMANGRHS